MHFNKYTHLCKHTNTPFRERASGKNGRLNPLRMDITTEVGSLFDSHPRRKNKARLCDITIVNPCASSNLENGARHPGKNLVDAIEWKKNSYRGSFPSTYCLLPLAMSTCGEVDSDVHALIKKLAIRRVEHRLEIKLQRVPASGGGDGGSMSSAAILVCFTASTFILHASPSLQTGGGACEHPTAPFARLGVCTRASYRGGNMVQGTGRRERSRGRERRREQGQGRERGRER